jgi:hypothetical protein
MDNYCSRAKETGGNGDVVLQKMLKIKWTERIKNEEVLRRVEEKINIMNTVRRRRGRYLVSY